MKSNRKYSLSVLGLLLGMLLTSSQVWADRGDQYLIPKVGAMYLQGLDVDLVYAVGAYYGYGINRNITIEGEIMGGFFGGNIQTGGGSYDITTVASYGVYRLPLSRRAYAKARMGLLLEHVSAVQTKFGAGFSGGAGVGMVLPQGFTVEGEFTLIEQNVSLISLGVLYAFK